MFYVILIIPMLILVAILVSVILFGIVAVVSAFVGGTTMALLIKNATIKKLLSIGFFTLFLIGILCLSPLMMVYFDLSALFFAMISSFIYISIAILSIVGIKLSKTITSKMGKTLLVIVFCILLTAALSLVIVTAFASAQIWLPNKQ